MPDVSPPSTSGPAAADLVERQREVASLTSLIEQAIDGGGRVALVEGPAGIGKSRLLAETRRQAEEMGATVLSGRGSELELEFPFGVVRQLFEAAIADPEIRARAFEGAAEAARPVLETLEEGSSADAAGASFAVLHGLFWLTLNIAGDRPLVLAIDDLHWCDRPSLRFVAYLVRRLEGLPLLVAPTLRSAEPGADPGLLAEIVHDPAVVSVRPGPLSTAGSRQLVRSRLGEGAEDEFSDACHAATGGNPLLLRQLLTALEAEGVRPEAGNAQVVRDIGPRAISRTVLLRLGRLSTDASAAARAVAVLGDGAALPAVARLADLDEPSAAEATAALARAEILRPEPPLAFVHPLVRDAVYHELPPGERELLHGRAARQLRDSSAGPDQVAAHLLLTPPRADPWAAEVLQEAGRSAMQRGAPESAAAYMQRALDEPAPEQARPGLLLELGIAEALTSGPASIEHLRAAYEALDDPLARAQVAAILGRALMFTGSPGEAAELAREAARELPPDLEDFARGLSAFEACTAFWSADWDSIRWLEDVEPAYADAGVGAQMRASAASIWAMYRNQPADRCAELALSALDGGALVEADSGLLGIVTVITLAHCDRPEVDDALEACLADAHRRGSLLTAAAVSLWRGLVLLRRGEIAEAIESQRGGWKELDQWGFGLSAAAYTAGLLARGLVELGDFEGARRELEVEVGDLAADGARYWTMGRLELAVAEGRNEDALAIADEVQERYRYTVNPASAPWRGLKAQALHGLGRTDEALVLAEEEVELARAFGAPGGLGRALRVLGQLRRDDGLDLLRESVEVLDGSLARLQLAKSLGALGGTLRRLRKPTEAREPLLRALELAEVCGATKLAADVRTELHATGARPRTSALEGVESLTPSERRVAGLAAEGNTNRDIAQSLYVTPKTVEVHLSNAYRKLGIRSRRELPAALAA